MSCWGTLSASIRQVSTEGGWWVGGFDKPKMGSWGIGGAGDKQQVWAGMKSWQNGSPCRLSLQRSPMPKGEQRLQVPLKPGSRERGSVQTGGWSTGAGPHPGGTASRWLLLRPWKEE